MKKIVWCLAILLCLPILAFCSDTLTTSIEGVPQVFQPTDANLSGDRTLPAARWMEFTECKGETACCTKLSNISLTLKSGTEPVFSAIDGMVVKISIDDLYQASGSILITWTLRVEGNESTETSISPWKNICSSWHGTVVETYRGGQVYSQAYVSVDGTNYKAVGQQLGMTIPDGTTVTNITTHDPTHTGSYLLKASDSIFSDGKLPATVWIKIYWANDTSRPIISKEGYRSLVVTLLPTS